MKKLVTFLAASTLAFSLLLANEQEGTIKAFQIKGDVQLMNNDTGATTPMKRGMEMSQGQTVLTGPGSKALLLLSNGGTINISENSRVNLVRFLQAPWDKQSKGQYLMLKADPSTSDTLIRLDHGEMVGKVKPLQPQSFYDVETPIGSAGVRGTTYLVSFFVSEDGQYMMKVGNIQGKVLVTTKMPADVTISEGGVAEAQMDPTATLSTGDVPEKSVVVIKARPEDVGNLPNVPRGTTPTSFNQLEDALRQIIAEVENPEGSSDATFIFVDDFGNEDGNEGGDDDPTIINTLDASPLGNEAEETTNSDSSEG